MMKSIQKFLRTAPLYSVLRAWVIGRKQSKELKQWKESGEGVPVPHLIKQKVIKDYAQKYHLRVLVETGTFFGDMVAAMKGEFAKIYSIELSEELYANAKKRFREEENIELICGDSGKVLGDLVERLDEPALFWLDGHYSGGITAKAEVDTPVLDEIACILDARVRKHVIIIDDARCFGADPAYPSLSQLSDLVSSKRSDMEITMSNDSIRIVPK